MIHRTRFKRFAPAMAALILLQTGCSTLLQDTRMPPPAQTSRCEGSEFINSGHLATLPIPVVAFFTPRVTLNAPDSGEILAKCGGKQQVNRKVQSNYLLCAPTIFVTTIITLGIFGYCPTFVSYEADVID